MSKDLLARYTSFTKDKNEMDKAAGVMRTELIRNLRAGKDGKDRNLPELSDATKDRRGRLAQDNRTDSQYRQFLSNMTFSGQFVRSLNVKALATTAQGREFSFSYDGVHIGYKDSDGDRYVSVRNSDIFRGLNNKDRQLTGVTERASITIRKQFIKYLQRR